MEKGFIITLSGISGAGKTHFIKSIIDRVDNFEKLKAVTTRERRKDEIDGIDKFFLSFAICEVPQPLSCIAIDAKKIPLILYFFSML